MSIIQYKPPVLIEHLGRIKLKPYHKQTTKVAKYKCYCGNEFIGQPRYVEAGKTRSCGCNYYGKDTHSKCVVDGCNSKPRSTRAKYCEVHYYRIRRTGKYDNQIYSESYVGQDGYKAIKNPNYEIFGSNDFVREHRVIGYDKYINGETSCHWCGIDLEFEKCHVDHVDEDRSNNSFDNLVISCPRCNATRSLNERIIKKNGLEYRGKKYTIRQLSEIAGIKYGTMVYRLRNGWSTEDAVNNPLRTTKKLHKRLDNINKK